MSTVDGPLRWELETAGGKRVTLYPEDLASSEQLAAAMERQLGVPGYKCPVYSDEDHRKLVEVILRLGEMDRES